MSRFFFIALGAALGANARYLVSLWSLNRFGSGFPLGTLLVNISGSLLLGFILAWSSEKVALSPEMRLFLTVGFLGSYTTFSSYAVETVALGQSLSFWDAVLNLLLNNGIGLLCAIAGTYLARQI